VKAAGRGAASVQLFVACSTETVQKAVDAVGPSTLMIVPTRFNGRDCYRVAWGVYPSADRASAAMRTLPDYFRTAGVSPRVVPAAEILR
jgi:septal ring-binding cell division protein DamX